MMYDCGFTKENNWFRYRAAAIIIENDCVLFATNEKEDYLYSVGGGVHMGEASDKCIEREVLEETGLNTRVKHLAVVCENFFKGKGGMITCSNEECGHSFKAPRKNAKKSQDDSDE